MDSYTWQKYWDPVRIDIWFALAFVRCCFHLFAVILAYDSHEMVLAFQSDLVFAFSMLIDIGSDNVNGSGLKKSCTRRFTGELPRT